MIEAIAVTRDVVLILGFVIVTSMVVIVGMAILRVTRRVDNAGKAAAAVVTGVMNPLKGVQGLLGRAWKK
mgnify:CR=1 FL=1